MLCECATRVRARVGAHGFSVYDMCFNYFPQDVWSKEAFVAAYTEKQIPRDATDKHWKELVAAASLPADTETLPILSSELLAADGMSVGAKMRLDEDRKSEEGDVVEYPDWVDMKMWHPVTQQTALEQAIEACEYLPMESRDLRTFDDITNKIGDVKACTTSLELEGLTSDIRAQFTLISQLNNSCKSAISELKSTISKRKNQKQKQEDDRKSKQAQEEKRANKEKEELERKRLGKVKKVSAFALPFQSIGFPLLQTFLDDDAFAAADKDYGKPWLIKSSSKMKQLLEQEGGKLATTLTRWRKTFPDNKIAKQEHKVQAPLMPAWGADELTELLSAIVPRTVQSALPRFVSAVDRPRLFGETEFLVSADTDADYLGYTRMQCHGRSEFYAISIKIVLDMVCGDDAKEAVALSELQDFVENLGEATAKDMKEKGIPIAYGVMEPGSILAVPFGWVTAFTTVGTGEGCMVDGVVTSFLPMAGLAEVEASIDAMMRRKAGDAPWLTSLRDIIAAEKVSARG